MHKILKNVASFLFFQQNYIIINWLWYSVKYDCVPTYISTQQIMEADIMMLHKDSMLHRSCTDILTFNRLKIGL